MNTKTKLLVCVICTTYNHAKYVRKCLEGFVQQKTTFKFRVIIHDDCSTDGTQDILREYEEKFPELFYVIYQKENQHSQRVPIVKKHILPLVTEKYVAFCEGDDYWINPNKLQQQVDYMESHPNCSLCVHDTMRVSTDEKSLGRVNGLNKDTEYTARNIIAAGGGGLFQTSSFLCKTEILKNRPPEMHIAGIGDYPMAINFAINGDVHYIGKVMSCYRVGDPSSWSSRTSDIKARLKRNYISYEALTRMNKFTQYRYNRAFAVVRGSALFFIYRYEKGLLRLLFHPRDMMLVLSWLFYKINEKTVGRIKRYLTNRFLVKDSA